eukprot:comp22295_c0_seq1/m.53329 comp22295_c0_seq1/g.53329  ORF comp22295_c0_seq1/g.53329 comp22295_c0_seq1/m.53329 type:complete len:553 (+) comp22295_c0_seq1:926-2584(+)
MHRTRGYILVKNCNHHDRHRREQHIVQRDEKGLKDCLASEQTLCGEPELRERERHIFVKRIQDENCHALVRPAPVDQQQRRKEAELANRVVRGPHSLGAFLAFNTNAQMCRLDHRHIVRAVADRERDIVEIVLDKTHNERLLDRRHAAADHGLALERKLKHVPLALRVERKRQRSTVNHKPNVVGLLLGLGLFDARNQALLHPGLVFFIHNHNVHRKMQQRARKANVDRRLLLVPREHPDLDVGARKNLNRARNTFLQLVLDRACAHENQILLNHLRNLVEGLLAPNQQRAGLVEGLVPCVVGALRELCIGKAERAQTVFRKRLEMLLCDVGNALVVALLEPLVDHGVGALCHEQDAFVWSAHNHRHALARRVELEHIHDLPCGHHGLGLAAVLVLADGHRVNVAGLERKPEMARRMHERKLVRRRRLVDELALLLFRDHRVAHRQHLEEDLELLAGLGLAVQVLMELLVAKVELSRLEILAGARRVGRELLAHPFCCSASNLCDPGAVCLPIHGALEELHHVAREGSCLVREDVLHLPKLLVEIRCVRVAL